MVLPRRVDRDAEPAHQPRAPARPRWWRRSRRSERQRGRCGGRGSRSSQRAASGPRRWCAGQGSGRAGRPRGPSSRAEFSCRRAGSVRRRRSGLRGRHRRIAPYHAVEQWRRCRNAGPVPSAKRPAGQPRVRRRDRLHEYVECVRRRAQCGLGHRPCLEGAEGDDAGRPAARASPDPTVRRSARPARSTSRWPPILPGLPLRPRVRPASATPWSRSTARRSSGKTGSSPTGQTSTPHRWSSATRIVISSP